MLLDQEMFIMKRVKINAKRRGKFNPNFIVRRVAYKTDVPGITRRKGKP